MVILKWCLKIFTNGKNGRWNGKVRTFWIGSLDTLWLWWNLMALWYASSIKCSGYWWSLAML